MKRLGRHRSGEREKLVISVKSIAVGLVKDPVAWRFALPGTGFMLAGLIYIFSQPSDGLITFLIGLGLLAVAVIFAVI